MYNLIKKMIYIGKSKINIALAFATSKIHYWSFIFGIMLLIVATISAYSVHMEGKTAQMNVQDMLSQFEKKQMSIESSYLLPEIPMIKPQNATKKDQTSIPISVLSPTFQIIPTEPALNITPMSTPQNITPISTPQIEYIPVSKLDYSPIAKLFIEKIDLNISVLSKWSYELLDISVCKFFGPDPNEAGNFVVIGHNDIKGVHFGNLDRLEIGDSIEMTDLTGRIRNYEIYEILTIKPNELDKLKTNEDYSVTLVTCSPDGKMRLVVKSRQNK